MEHSSEDPNNDDLANTEARFQELTAGWHVDTVSAIREAQADLTRDDEHWRDHILVPLPNDIDDPEIVEHYHAPPPPPLPRLAGATVRALALMLIGLGALATGALLGFDTNLTLLLGSGGILTGAGLLVMRLRPDHSDGDDGAVL